MKHTNDFMIVGPIRHTDYYAGPDGTWGFLKLGIGAIRLSITNKPSDSLLEAAKNAKGAILTAAKMKPNKAGDRYELTGSDSNLILVQFDIAPLTQATACGIIHSITIDHAGTHWGILKCSYRGGKDRKEWKERYVLVKLDRQWGPEYTGKTMWVTGTVRPKYQDKWQLHLESIVSVVLGG